MEVYFSKSCPQRYLVDWAILIYNSLHNGVSFSFSVRVNGQVCVLQRKGTPFFYLRQIPSAP